MKTVLILGGSGFIGGETVQRLLHRDTLKIIIVNRGKSWDWDYKDQILPHVEHFFKWNRKYPLSTCTSFLEWLEQTCFIDFVIDFSGYKSVYLENCFEELTAKTGLYIYISTDSVYEVCVKSHNGPTKETDDVPPLNKKDRKTMKRKDSYGYNKLKCEQIVRQSGMNYLILRLADVIGPRDTTERWWQLQLWVQAACRCCLPIIVPESCKRKEISVVYVSDIVELLTKVTTGQVDTELIKNNTFNLACKENITLEGLCCELAKYLHEKCSITYSSNPETPQIYPSVEKGPLDLSKSRSLLGWDPTPLSKTIKETVFFYEELRFCSDQQKRKSDMLNSVLEEDLHKLYPEDIRDHLLVQIRNLFKASKPNIS